MIGHNGAEFIYSDDLAATRQELQLARTGQHHMRNFETRYVHKNGRIVPLAWSGVWSEPEQKHFFFGRDMTERKAAEEQLRRLAHFDQLTGLPNRVSLHKDLDTILRERAGNPALPITVATLDLDAFKDVNDTLGHSVGDKLLQEVARRLTSAPDEARVYRLGEDEFVLLLLDCGDPVLAFGVVETLLKRLGGHFDVDGHRLFIAASAGIAIAPNHGSTVDDLLANADLALYDAKAAGGRLCRFYVPTLRSQAKRRRELDMELPRAFTNQEFLLYFQPQVSSSDGSIVGAEALLRWHHPERGILAPWSIHRCTLRNAVAIETGRWILTARARQQPAGARKAYRPFAWANKTIHAGGRCPFQPFDATEVLDFQIDDAHSFPRPYGAVALSVDLTSPRCTVEFLSNG
jgi:diguanylate cyclase (GGDEF)-like protein